MWQASDYSLSKELHGVMVMVLLLFVVVVFAFKARQTECKREGVL